MDRDYSKPFYLYEKKASSGYFSKAPAQNSARLGEKLFDESLVKEGSLSRGFSMGTNNDLGMNSRLNLQLAGKLNATTNIIGAISDENIPIQADGTTQRLQEFDRIYLKVFTDSYSLSVGDIVMEKPNGYFLNPNKKLKGADYYLSKIDSSNWRQARATVGIAKGKYTRYQIQGQEGVQGPYLLHGSSGEKYIIILSGSERIFVNGKLMQRGEDKDYVIDYNTAQLTFTPNCVMSSEKRIVAEFEFTDQQYVRFAMQGALEYHIAGRDAYFNYYREQDAKSQTIGYTLNDSTKQLFINSSTPDSHFWIDASQKTNFNTTENLYTKRDTITNSSRHDSIFVYSNSQTSQLYRVSFTYVGSNLGDYVRADAAVNGRIYKWIAPENGIPQGDYVAKILVAAPQQKEVFTFGIKPKAKNDGLWFEAALSRMNYNTFAISQKVQDLGAALNLNYQHQFKLKDSTKTITLRNNYEFTSNGFVTEGQFRSPEFAREWNLAEGQDKGLHLFSLGAEYKKAKRGTESLSLSAMIRANHNKLKLASADKWTQWLEWERNSDVLISSDSLSKTLFIRNNMKWAKPVKKIKMGMAFEQEYKEQINQQTDSLSGASWRFESLETFLQNTDSSNLIKTSYKIRQDLLPKQNHLLLASISQDFNLSYKRTKNFLKKTRSFAKSEFSTALVFRKLETKNDDGKAPENHILGRLEHRLTLWRGLWVSTALAETSSGLVQKQDFVYVEVPAGQGIYKWTDYNNNGLKELGEFEIASFKDEAKYIKLLTPTDQYSKAYQSKLNLTARLQPGAVLHSSKGASGFFARFSNQTVLRLDQNLPQAVQLSDFFRPSSSATTSNSSLRNMLQFNRSAKLWSCEYILMDNHTRSSLTSGVEASKQVLHTLIMRLNLSAPSLKNKIPIILSQTSNLGNKEYSSESYPTRNYQIDFYDDELKLSYQISTEASFSANYKYINKHENLTNENAAQQLMGLEWKFARGKKPLSIRVQSSYSKASYNGEATSPTAYTMLDGLKAGNNFLWEVDFDKNINKYFQLTVVYQGRSNPSAPVVHWGSVQAKAFF